MAHPYASHKSLHTERVGRMLGGYAKDKMGPRTTQPHMPSAAMPKAGEAALPGAKTKMRGDKFARGGKVRGKTNININIAPPPADNAPPSAAVASAMPPMAGPPPMPPGPPPGAMPGGPPPGMMKPPGANRGGRFASGGKVNGKKKYDDGGDVGPSDAERAAVRSNDDASFQRMISRPSSSGVSAGVRPNPNATYDPRTGKASGFKGGGSVKAEGIRNGTKVQHAKQGDGVTQKKGDTNRPPVITKKGGGRVSDFSEKKKRNYPIDDASGGGLGRLEKVRAYGKRA